MDKATRNALRAVITRCRRLLETATQEQLEGSFGIYRGGRVEDADQMGHLSADDLLHRDQIVAHLHHIEAAGFKPGDAVAQLVREVAYTHLNRLCAFKMMERRKVIKDAVSQGLKSNGFMFYLADHPDDEELWSTGKQDLAYEHFVTWLGTTLSAEIGALFSPLDPANQVFPPAHVLQQVLDLINGDELRDVWDQEETIGWIYQYFTPKEQRDKARKESVVPRNSYELAFLNQFYTPHYVVEFLVDNTLGRMWYEMRRGETKLRETCRYLVYRPNEIFLAGNESATDTEGDDHVYVRHRPKRDPRDIAILDPACGSGHFLLYCFDVLSMIYEEAWDDPDLGHALRAAYRTIDDLRRALPGLILERNLHGIDIDLRATQIASLALWLRAQTAYQGLGIKREHRPVIVRSNLVCAEPMPGERDMLQEFVAGLQPRVLGQIVEVAFEEMRLAGEAGSLLKIEDAIRSAVIKAKRLWEAEPAPAQLSFFPRDQPPVQGELAFDVAGITDARFWDQAETRILEELQSYAASATNGPEYAQTLFADDAERGFAFIDLCRRKYDVVLMNPPFGAPAKDSKAYIDRTYPRSKNDIYAAFVERGVEWLRWRGMLGAITSRTGFFLTSFRRWREEILLGEARPTAVADLGQGVLDTAMVETAAYCLAATR